MKKMLPIGNAIFKSVREMGYYYIDKTLMIKDFIELGDAVSLITRPRRFGKTLNLTMLRDFFDVASNNKAIFDGLAIMDTGYVKHINSRPVIFLSFKDCKANNSNTLLFLISKAVKSQYDKFKGLITDKTDDRYFDFFTVYDKLRSDTTDINYLQISIQILEEALTVYYKAKPIVLIDEYDQPIIGSYEYGYYNELSAFFSGFYGAALKDQEFMHQAMLTGIQRVVKENIFSQLNNISVYTVLDDEYSQYFGFTQKETYDLLNNFDLSFNENVARKYNGYIFGKTEIYNPWSLLNYAKTGKLDDYWLNTSTNYLIKQSIDGADGMFQEKFQELISKGSVKVGADLRCSFIELKSNNTLWGLLINAGYITVSGQISQYLMTVRIPNDEVAAEFVRIVAGHANVQDMDLHIMFQCLFDADMDGFLNIYREIVISCTSYFDAKENAYHMLFLGMCISLRNIYNIFSNVESGHGRNDIIMESLSAMRPHIIIEFKQGGDIEMLKIAALSQIIENSYYSGLTGDVLCVGIAHDKKRCAVAHRTIKQ